MLTMDLEKTLPEEPSSPAPTTRPAGAHPTGANPPGDDLPFSVTKAAAPYRSALVVGEKWLTHHPKAGINPLVDAAASLFSLIGKLKVLPRVEALAPLQKELINEIHAFEEATALLGYRTEYLLVSRYTLCATLDDIVADTPWGNQGQWEPYRLGKAFNQDVTHQDRFFLILERITKDPARYIDLMEFMYLALSLGYKGRYRATEYNRIQLEKITHILYQHIRAHRGEISHVLSPMLRLPLKRSLATKGVTGTAGTKATKDIPWFSLWVTIGLVAALFFGLSVLLDTLSDPIYHQLIRIGNAIAYETHPVSAL